MSEPRYLAPVSVTAVEADDSGRHWIELPEEFWQAPLLSEHTRFDFLAANQSLLLRACPHEGGPLSLSGHPEDPEFTPGSHCGLFRRSCAGCGVSTITEHADIWPAGWLELSELDSDHSPLGSATLCSRACVATWAASEAELRAVAGTLGPRLSSW